MCPPPKSPPPLEIDLQCNNEQIVLLLDKYSEKSYLPRNVLVDASPYRYPPSELPEGIWYMVQSGEKKEWIHGFWKVKEAPREIYSNGVITGWKTILEYFKGQTPSEQKTDWVMQEFGITRKELCDKDKTKDSKLLCRVFRGSEIETHSQNFKDEIGLEEFDFLASIIPDINSPSGDDPLNETRAKWEAELKNIVEADDNKTTFPRQNSFELDSISRDDYIELNDIVGPMGLNSIVCQQNSLELNLISIGDHVEPNDLVGSVELDSVVSQQNSSELEGISKDDYMEMNDLVGNVRSESSSSRNSSCTSNLSDEYFDSVGFLREIEEDEKKKQPISKYSFVASNDVVLQHTPSELQMTNDAEAIKLLEFPEAVTTKGDSLLNKTVAEQQTAKRGNSDSKTEDTSGGNNQNAGPSRDKKASSSRVKKLKPYFCFLF